MKSTISVEALVVHADDADLSAVCNNLAESLQRGVAEKSAQFGGLSVETAEACVILSPYIEQGADQPKSQFEKAIEAN